MIAVVGPLWLWSGPGGSWHFVTIPEEQCGALRGESLARRRGFGSVKVEARIWPASAGEEPGIAWRTSVFPVKDGGYILPVKADVRRRAGISAGDSVKLELEILD